MLDINVFKNKNILIIGNVGRGKTVFSYIIKTDNCVVFDDYRKENRNDLQEYYDRNKNPDTNPNKNQLIVITETVDYLPKNAYFDIIVVFKQNNSIEYQRNNIDYVYKHCNSGYERDIIQKYCEDLKVYEVYIQENDLKNNTHGHYNFSVNLCRNNRIKLNN